jgi:hypothetical protein
MEDVLVCIREMGSSLKDLPSPSMKLLGLSHLFNPISALHTTMTGKHH